MRLIDADALGLTDMEIIMCNGDYKEAMKMLIDKIENAPTIEERKNGRWIPKDDGRYHCSSCDGIAPKGYRWDFCPNCGADMRGNNDA